ncbi:hypothetical protein DPMN_186702 [Dreissena polymorpha]|uniref:Uncharacterized protein n=1 Tax=Dreissena polymorpha TaxID=45954 RepID=A0A9D4DQ45_DREPO|nr:hypothetical protein DPMN_186702 [Dreissena polymorpha]
MLIWIKDASNLDKDEEAKAIAFVYQYVTCEKSDKLADLVRFQMHAHSRTCKKSKIKSVVGFPDPIHARNHFTAP